MNVGIITLFYNSTNYGGVLQSYALTQALNQMEDVYAEQICYEKSYSTSYANRWKKIFSFKKVFRHIKLKVERALTKKERGIAETISKKRLTPFGKFVTDHIQKTATIYTQKTIPEVLTQKDVLIAGSDQVWNVNYYDEVYRLDFIPSDKYKMSYAAGVSCGTLTSEQREIFKNTLRSYAAISVREEAAVDILQPLTDTKVQWVLDPTLLLSPADWDKICSGRKIRENYIFCFFLGRLSLENKRIIEFAKKRNLKIVSMPYLAVTSRKDSDFGDYKVYDAGPQDFLSFVKYATYIFTDSFHATVFSHIYQREFFVFGRAKFNAMNDRIESLTALFNTRDRFCDTKERTTLKYIENLPPIDYSKPFPKFEKMKKQSENFLKDNLKKAEEKIHGNQ